MHRPYHIVDTLIRKGLDWFGSPVDGKHPAWWCQTVDAYFERFNQRLITRIVAAQERGVGIDKTWVSHDTDAEAVLAWFDTGLAERHEPRFLRPYDIIRVFVIHASKELARTDTTVSQDHLLAMWEGERRQWWAEGRDQIAAAIPYPNTHDGLLLVLNRGATAVMAALTTHDKLAAQLNAADHV